MPTQALESETQRCLTIALVGNPNSGKTTLFNALTGFRQRVGNYPGVTVEKKTGRLRRGIAPNPIELMDLPGAYSLAAGSEDEAIVLDVLLGLRGDLQPPDKIVVVVDASNLNRNLFLVGQIVEIGKPVIVALNMMDLAEGAGIRIDVAALAEKLGAMVLPIVATKGTGVDELAKAIENLEELPDQRLHPAFPDCVVRELEGLSNYVNGESEGSNEALSRVSLMQCLLDPGGFHEEALISRCGPAIKSDLEDRRRRIAGAGESVAELEAWVRYDWIGGVVDASVTRVQPQRRSRSEALDRLLTHRVVGLAVLLTIMGLCFQAIYSWASPLMDVVESAFANLGVAVATMLPAGALRSLIADGAIAGVGAVLMFLPQILILFLFIAVLEDCGYMARAAFLLDRWMGMLGLNGKSFIPLVSSFACAVPGIMATRTIEDRRDRFITILIAPLMSCSARLPVYILLVGAFIPNVPVLGGVIGAQALAMLSMYLLGVGVAVVVAFILKHTLFKGKPQPFLMELPTYKWPSVKTVCYRMYEQGREFCMSAGTIIFAVAIVVWAMGYYPRSSQISSEYAGKRAAWQSTYETEAASIAAEFDASLDASALAKQPQVQAARAAIHGLEDAFREDAEKNEWDAASVDWRNGRAEADRRIAATVARAGDAGSAALSLAQAEGRLNDHLRDLGREEAGALLRHSLLGRAGAWIEPIVKPLGWDWRIGTAAIASFPAREVVIATLGTIYNLGADLDERSVGLRERLQAATWPDGRPVFNVAVALSIMVFFSLCCQCAATLAAIKRETKSWRWPLFTFSYMTGLAYVAAFVTYRVAMHLS